MFSKIILAETKSSEIVKGPHHTVLKKIWNKALFQRELEIARVLRKHPSDFILSLVSVDPFYQTLVYPEAECDLHQWRKQSYEPGVLKKYFFQILQGLYDLYRCRVEHYDMKPKNILVFSDGTVKIADFGLAVHRGRDYRKRTGTYAYAAPELICHHDHYVPHSMDVYSTSIMFLYLLFPSFYQSQKRFLTASEYTTLHDRADLFLQNSAHPTLAHLLLQGMHPDPTQRMTLPVWVEETRKYLDSTSDNEPLSGV